MTDKAKIEWVKLVARSCAPLQWSALAHQRSEGFSFGDLTWYYTDNLVVQYNSPLSTTFVPTTGGFTTNFGDHLKEINPNLDQIAAQVISTIDKDLLLQPDTTKEDLRSLYTRMRADLGLMVLGFTWSRILEVVIKEQIGAAEFETRATDLFQPYRQTLLGREHAAIEFQRGRYHRQQLTPGELATVTEQLTKEFGFVHSEYVGESWTAADYKDQIIGGSLTETAAKNQLVGSDYDAYANWLILMARKALYIYDEGKSAVVRANWALRETLKVLHYDEKVILNYTEAEFMNWLDADQVPAETDLRSRSLYFAIAILDRQYNEYLSKESVEKLIQDQGLTEFLAVEDDIKELKGSSAFKGVVQGKVRIVFSQADAKLLQSGEILVTSMTTPELVVGIRNAAAIVTDEGGITSHAAIIAREMKKPCVIGTKIGTKILKDGDLVEVDAEQGIVRKLN